MPNKIQIKRGSKDNLPILKNGELAYALDTKELYVGDGSYNSNISNFENNLVLNSGFNLPIYGDTEKDSMGVSSSKKFMGNYYITTSNQLNITKTYDGFISLNTTGTLTLEYREKLLTGDGLPFNNQIMTASFDIINNSGGKIQAQGGTINNRVAFTVPVGYTRQSFNFTMTYQAANTSSIIIFGTSNSATLNIKVGNVRIEKGANNGNYAVSNPTYLESLALEMPYKIYAGRYRATGITINTITFIIPCNINKILFKSGNVSISNVNVTAIYNQAQVIQYGFIYSTSFNADGCISVIATKTAHLLTDAIIDIKLELYIN